MDFAALLHEEYHGRRARNARYSLRAFARDLRTDHASLSQWLRGKRPLSATQMRRIGARLRIVPAQIERCCAARRDAAVLDAIRRAPGSVGSRRLARRTGIATDEINIALHRLLVDARLRMPAVDHWIAEVTNDA